MAVIFRPLTVAASLLLVMSAAIAETDAVFDEQGNTVSVSRSPFQPRAGVDDVPFTRYDGSQFGLSQDNLFTPRDFYPPFFNGGGIASGDIDRDGWPDIVSANGKLIVIFTNQKGERFVPLEIDVTGQDDTAIFNVTLVDINGDGWLDIFGTTYLQGNFYLLSEEGRFSSTSLRQPPRATRFEFNGFIR